MSRRRGIASRAWGRYDPHPPPEGFVPKKKIRLVAANAHALADPLCDYLEGAIWWIARSKKSVRSLQRAFADQVLACLLYECVGAMIDLGRSSNGEYLIQIQLVGAGEWDVDLSLEEAGIYLEEVVKEGI